MSSRWIKKCVWEYTCFTRQYNETVLLLYWILPKTGRKKHLAKRKYFEEYIITHVHIIIFISNVIYLINFGTDARIRKIFQSLNHEMSSLSTEMT